MPAPAILLVEDDATTADTVRRYLERAGFAVVVVTDGDRVLAVFHQTAPTAVILDVTLPGRDGFALCRALRATSAVPILLLTARSTEDDILHGLGLGADDYVTKPFSPRELVARLGAVLRRSGAARSLTCGDLVIDLERHVAHLAGEVLTLTPAELRLLATLARRPGRAFRREELLAAGEAEGGPRVIDVHVTNLRRKLVGARAPRIETVYGVGYRLGERGPGGRESAAPAHATGDGLAGTGE